MAILCKGNKNCPKKLQLKVNTANDTCVTYCTTDEHEHDIKEQYGISDDVKEVIAQLESLKV